MTEGRGQPAARPPAFVLVVDTSLMNVSIASVVEDLDTTVSGVQSAIALEALVSAAFILIGSKVADLIGRKQAYVLGLFGSTLGASAMAAAQSPTAVVVFWAMVGGLGASRLLPAMQSLIHDNFERGAEEGLRDGRRRGRDRHALGLGQGGLGRVRDRAAVPRRADLPHRQRRGDGAAQDGELADPTGAAAEIEKATSCSTTGPSPRSSSRRSRQGCWSTRTRKGGPGTSAPL
jgi:hypothetical protein